MDIGGVESLLSSLQQGPPVVADASVLRVGCPGMFAFAFIRSKWIILTVAVAINLFLLFLLTSGLVKDSQSRLIPGRGS